MDTSDGNGDPSLTVGAYLDEWLEVQRHRLQPMTLRSYRGNVDRYLAPNIGDVALVDLDIRQLEHLYADLMSRGGKDGRPLSRRTVEYAAATLGSALNDAVRTGLLDRNPARLARLPRVDPTSTTEDDEELQVWTAEAVRRFVEQSRDHGCGTCGSWPSGRGCAGASSSACDGSTSISSARRCTCVVPCRS